MTLNRLVDAPWIDVRTADLLEGFTWAQGATLVAALLAGCGVAATILATSARGRRDHLASLYADALHSVADYLEGPCRIRRKDGTATHRNAITAAISDVQSQMDHSQGVLRLHARDGVADAFDAYVKAAKIEAGQQMVEAWKLDPVQRDDEVNLGAAYDRTVSHRFRDHVVTVMQADLARRWHRPWKWATYRQLVGRAPGLPPRGGVTRIEAGPDARASQDAPSSASESSAQAGSDTPETRRTPDRRQGAEEVDRSRD